MQIQNSTPTLRFNITGEPQRQALLSRLTEGQTLEARVLDRLADGRWAVRVQGQTLVAESHLSLMPGQRIDARVESLGPPLVLSLTGQANAEETALNRAFQSLGLPDDAVNGAIVKGLIAQGRPVGREQIQALRTLLTDLQGAVDINDPQTLETTIARALFLQTQNLPVTPDTLAAYLSQLPPGVLGVLFQNLGDLLRSLRLRTPQTPIADLTDRLANALPDASTLSGESLRRLIHGLGLDIEGRLSTWLDNPADLPDEIRNSLRATLLRLQQQLDALALDARSTQTLHAHLREALQTLNTLSAVNLPTAHREAITLQIPFLIAHTPVTADLQIFYQKQGADHIDPDNLRFTLAIDLTGLGHVRFDLTVVNRRAACRIYAEDAARATFLQSAEPDLKTALETAGYTVTTLACHIAPRPIPPSSDATRAVGFDFRV